ncbi:MAG TPA: hypothetical protein VFX92_14535 [Candidatus Krumholzibacteria bacterium]|nr:hypothetical protein [Candidatus Krumholzibacteria bacterium]
MQNRSAHACLLGLIAAALCGCASITYNVPDWLPPSEEAATDPRGGWIELQVTHATLGATLAKLDGELLAVEADTLYVLAGKIVHPVALASVVKARLYYYDSNPGSVSSIAAGGALSTLSNGAFLIFTAPAWLAVGAGESSTRAHEGQVTRETAEWDDFRPYARFPAGLPSSLHAGSHLASESGQVLAGGVDAEPVPPAESWATRPRPTNAIWFYAGIGPGLGANREGPAWLAGVNMAHKALMGGLRVSTVKREALIGAYPDAGGTYYPNPGRLYDLALLVGLRGNLRAVHVTVSAGPAAYAVSFDDLADLNFSAAAQAEFLVWISDSVGIGSALSYDWNDFEDFYVVSFGLAFGSP